MAEDVINIVVLDVFEDGFTVDPETKEQRAVEWVTWAKRGSGYSLNAASTTDKVARIRKTHPDLWAAIEPAYNQWKKGQSVPDGETSLAVTALFTRQQIEMLKALHVTSVEQLAKLTDSDLRNLGMGGNELRQKARHFVNNHADTAKVATLLAERDSKIEAMQARLAELEAQSRAQPVENEKDSEDVPAVRRGRPPRNREEAA